MDTPSPSRPHAFVHVEADVASSALSAALAAVELPQLGRSDRHLALAVPGGPDRLRAVALRLRARIVAHLRTEVTWVGVGGYVQTGRDSRASQREAREALTYGRRLGGPPRVVLYEDVLAAAAVASDPRLRDRLAAILDPVESYDRRSRGVLMSTLETFLRSGLSSSRAAAELGVHRHTLVYRIDRAEQILGRSARRSTDRVILDAAFLARQLQATDRRG